MKIEDIEKKVFVNIEYCFYLYSVPEPLVKRIIYQTLLAVNFCHQHNVRFVLFIMNIYRRHSIKPGLVPFVWLGLKVGLASN